MTLFPLTLHKTYYNHGFFNVTVAFDHLVRADDGPLQLILENSPPCVGKINRRANLNGTARIFGGVELRDWFQKNFDLGEVVQVEFVSLDTVRLSR